MEENNPFPFLTIKEAWDFFTKAARVHFAKLIKHVSEQDKNLRKDIKFLKHRDYCARLLYILNMFAFEGDHEGEFDLDWAMLIAKPMSAAQARNSVDDLIALGLMGELEIEEDEPKRLSDGKKKESDQPNKRVPPNKSGGSTSAETRFDFNDD